MSKLNIRRLLVILSLVSIIALLPCSASVAVEDLTKWPLWPQFPSSTSFSTYTDFDIIVYDPLSFTIVGFNRDYLSWILPQLENTDDPDSVKHDSRGGKLYLANLVTSTLSNDIDQDPYGSSRNLSYITTGDMTQLSSSYLQEDLISQSVIPEYVEVWHTFNPSVSETVIFANQTFPSFIIGDESSGWLDYISDKEKGPDPYYWTEDPGHASTSLIWTDNYWLESLDSYRGYLNFLEKIYDNEDWGDAILFSQTNEGFVHAYSTEDFTEKWGIMPLPAFHFSIYKESVNQLSLEYPRMNVLDGPFVINDVESSGGLLRRILLGTTGTGSMLSSKQLAAWGLEESRPSSQVETLESPPSRNSEESHTWGVYAINLAQGTGTTVEVSPSSPEPLWSVSNIYWEESGDVKGKVVVNGVWYDYGSIPSDYEDYADVKMSLARPVIGVTEDEITMDRPVRTWHVLLVTINKDDHFVLLDINPNSGAILQAIDLGNADYSSSPTIYLQYDGTTTGYHWNVHWDERIEWLFPSRIGAAATDADGNVSTESSVVLVDKPLLTEVYIHLSNGAIYQWDVSKAPSKTGEDVNPKLVTLMSYTGANDKEEWGAPPVQDFDVTYLEALDNDGIHRFLATPIKIEGNKKDDAGTVLEDEADFRAVVVIDVTKLVDMEAPMEINKANAWGAGNLDTFTWIYDDSVDPDDPVGYYMMMAGGEFKQDQQFFKQDIAISSPIFINGKLVIASFQPEGGSTVNQEPLGSSQIFILDAEGASDGAKVANTDGSVIYTEYDKEFVGGASLSATGVLSVAHIDRSSDSSNSDISLFQRNISTELGINTSGGSDIDGQKVLYWKVR